MKQYLVSIIILLFLYYLNSIRSESFQCELSYKIRHSSNTHTSNNIVVQVIQSNSNLNNYITEEFCNLRIIRYLNDIFSSTDNVFKLKKLLPVNYNNNLLNSYHHVPSKSSNNDVSTTSSNPPFKTSDEIGEFVNNDLELFDILLRNGGYLNDILKRIINTEYLDDSTLNIVFVPYLKNDIIELTLDYSSISYPIIVCGMYNNEDNSKLSIPYIPSNLKKNWVSNYIVDANYKSQNTQEEENKKTAIADLYKQKKKKINRIKKIENEYKDLDTDEYYKNIKRLQKLYLTDMNDIPIINNFIKNKKSQKKLDELFYKPTDPFNSKYKWRNKTNTNNEVTKLKDEISILERQTDEYKKRNDEKTNKITKLKTKLEIIDKEIYDKHRLNPIRYETELVKQQRADHNKEIYINKLYFDKLDIILTMAIYISNIKQIVNPIPYTLFTPSSTQQTTNSDKTSGCDLFDDNEAKQLCEEKETYIYDAEVLVPTSPQSYTISVEDTEEDGPDTQCINLINNENIPRHNLKFKNKKIGGVKFKIPKNHRLYNRQIQEYLNSNDYYLNNFSDSYI